MAVRVNINTPRGSDYYVDATSWHVDDSGRLHVTEVGNGNHATYHANAWLSVERVKTEPMPSE